jgi:hypothetical protein
VHEVVIVRTVRGSFPEEGWLEGYVVCCHNWYFRKIPGIMRVFPARVVSMGSPRYLQGKKCSCIQPCRIDRIRLYWQAGCVYLPRARHMRSQSWFSLHSGFPPFLENLHGSVTRRNGIVYHLLRNSLGKADKFAKSYGFSCITWGLHGGTPGMDTGREFKPLRHYLLVSKQL